MDVIATSHGFYFFRFKTVAAMEEVIEGGLWLFQGQPIILQQWELGMALRKHKHMQVPVWLRLKHLPVEFWTNEGLSIVASGIGRPVYQDAITKACTRLDFARVCVMLDISSKLPKHVFVMIPRDGGGRLLVEWMWSMSGSCQNAQLVRVWATKLQSARYAPPTEASSSCVCTEKFTSPPGLPATSPAATRGLANNWYRDLNRTREPRNRPSSRSATLPASIILYANPRSSATS
ncbi:UNVERIFIED_CONTAM: hypothetical protein Slati_0891600 [Sesamum latifolium]|uniref:DUF4283 domain-containing protein n=1 Tax=Sesamum latifolium TaxID=2727402 RepID=A0AAW2XMZ8_9LAMI